MSAIDDRRPAQALDAARARRVELRHAMEALEAALAAPAPGRAGDWRAVVHRRVRALREALDDHIAETEGGDGLLAQVVAEAPRLANAVGTVRREHSHLADTVASLLARCEPADGDTAAIREEGLAVLGRLARHRQKGADLLYEAYSVDISVGD